MKKMLVMASLVLAACGGAKEETPAVDSAAMVVDSAAMAAPASTDSAAMLPTAPADSVMAGDTAKKM